jgi:hypothetical protein
MSGLEAEAARELRNQQDFVEDGHYVLKGIVLIFIINNQIIWSHFFLFLHSRGLKPTWQLRNQDDFIRGNCFVVNGLLLIFILHSNHLGHLYLIPHFHGLKPKAARVLSNEWVGGRSSKGIEKSARFR